MWHAYEVHVAFIASDDGIVFVAHIARGHVCSVPLSQFSGSDYNERGAVREEKVHWPLN
jgi:hypothetical protein